MMSFSLLHELGTEHRWPAGQMHELLIAKRIGAVTALAILVVFCRALARKNRRTPRATASTDATAP